MSSEHDGDNAAQGERPGFASPACALHEMDPAYTGLPRVVDAQTRRDVMRWRQAERARLIAARQALDRRLRARLGDAVAQRLDEYLGPVSGLTISAYWPLRGEPDLRALLGRLAARGNRCALPVVLERGAPLAFHRWQPGEAVHPGFWNIPVPVAVEAVVPEVIIAPVVGFDRQCFRLGYGGGYFDRTLAALAAGAGTGVRVIGVGYALGALPSIFPLPHDIPMQAIVTEREVHLPASEQAHSGAP